MSLMPKHEYHDCGECGETWVCRSMDCEQPQEAPCYADTGGYGPEGWRDCVGALP